MDKQIPEKISKLQIKLAITNHTQDNNILSPTTSLPQNASKTFKTHIRLKNTLTITFIKA